MERVLDVSDLEPCEPLQRALEASQSLNAGDHLRVIHRREPRPLFELLEKGGFHWHCRPGGDSRFHIYIWRNDDPVAAQSVRHQIGD